MWKLSSMTGGEQSLNGEMGDQSKICHLWQSEGLVVTHHRARPQVHNAHHAGQEVNVHVPQSRAPEQMSCHYGGPHYLVLVLVLSFFDWNANDTWWCTAVSRSLSHRVREISANLGGGHGSWWDCSSIFSWEGAVGTSASLVVMGQSVPWATDRDPLGGPNSFCYGCAGSAGLGKLTSNQFMGAVATKTSSSVKWTSGSIACWSSHHTFHQMAQFTGDKELGPLHPVLKHPGIGEGLTWLGKSAVLAAKPWVGGSLNLYFSREGCASRWVWSLSTPFAQLHAFGTSNEAHTFWANSQQSLCWGPPAVLSTRSVFLLGGHATVSNPYGARQRAQGRREPLCWPEPPHQGVPRGGAPWGYSKSSSLSASGLNQSDLSFSALSSCQVGRGNWWASSILVSLSGLSSDDEVAFPQWRLHATFAGKD